MIDIGAALADCLSDNNPKKFFACPKNITLLELYLDYPAYAWKLILDEILYDTSASETAWDLSIGPNRKEILDNRELVAIIKGYGTHNLDGCYEH